MTTSKLLPAEIQRIAVFRALQLGDSLCAVPAWRALRGAFPQAHITLIGLPWAQGFVHRFSHLFDDFVAFPGLPGFPERSPDLYEFPFFLGRVQRRQFDLALQMHGDGSLSNSLVGLFAARFSGGFYLPGAFQLDPDLSLPYPQHEPEVWRHLRLVERLGLPLRGDGLEFPLFAEDRRALAALPGAAALQPDRYAVLHPGARAEQRRWPAENFARVADALAERGLAVVLTGAPSEAPLTRAVSARMHVPAIDLAGATSLGGLAALLDGARLLVSNDTGVSHLAAALQTPSVVLYLASDPERWAPLDRRRHRVVRCPVSVEDRPADVPGPDRVIAEVEDLLQQSLPSTGRRPAAPERPAPPARRPHLRQEAAHDA
ncbi:MAG: glycosyltransferase family 9 protein [Chloroflexota bacterium]